MTDYGQLQAQITAYLEAQIGAQLAELARKRAALIDRWPALNKAQRRRALRTLGTSVAAIAGAVASPGMAAGGPVILARAWQLGGASVIDTVSAAGFQADLPESIGTLDDIVPSTVQALAADIDEHVVTALRDADYELPGLGTGIDFDAVKALSDDTYADVLKATQYVNQSTKEFIRAMSKEYINVRIEEGETAVQTSAKLAEDLKDLSIDTIQYVNGARHTVADYVDMLIRTKTAQAHQLGTFAQCRRLGIDQVQVLDGPECGLTSHDDTEKANGLILDLDEAIKYPLSHPRCRRTSTPYLATVASLADTQPSSPAAQRFTVRQASMKTPNGMSAAQRRHAAKLKKRAS